MITKSELLLKLASIPEDMPITFIHEDFPHDIRSIGVIDVTAPYSEKKSGAGYYYQSFYPESEDVPVFKVLLLS